MEFSTYQAAASETVQLDTTSATGRVELVLGLMSEVGALSRLFKKYLRDGVSLEYQSEALKNELGDVLWYVAMVAGSMGIDLNEVAALNLQRVRDRYRSVVASSEAYVPKFDESYLPDERFPRKLLFQLRHVDKDGKPHVEFTVEDAWPNEFPNGNPTPGKGQGFNLRQALGDVVNDNAQKEDGYRYHDAVHIAFMTVLGWSPVMRALLRLKRKSNPIIDDAEDGARACDLEEALSASLKEMSATRNNFQAGDDIDGEVRDTIHRLVLSLEVTQAPLWLWSEAVSQGYRAMSALIANNGGWILADLDKQQVAYFTENPGIPLGPDQ